MNFDTFTDDMATIAEQYEYDFIEAMEEGQGGTVTLRNIEYTLLIDMSDKGVFTLSTMKDEDEEESNTKEVKTMKGVKGYLKKFGHNWTT